MKENGIITTMETNNENNLDIVDFWNLVPFGVRGVIFRFLSWFELFQLGMVNKKFKNWIENEVNWEERTLEYWESTTSSENWLAAFSSSMKVELERKKSFQNFNFRTIKKDHCSFYWFYKENYEQPTVTKSITANQDIPTLNYFVGKTGKALETSTRNNKWSEVNLAILEFILGNSCLGNENNRTSEYTHSPEQTQQQLNVAYIEDRNNFRKLIENSVLNSKRVYFAIAENHHGIYDKNMIFAFVDPKRILLFDVLFSDYYSR
jgi:hypothetical protein